MTTTTDTSHLPTVYYIRVNTDDRSMASELHSAYSDVSSASLAYRAALASQNYRFVLVCDRQGREIALPGAQPGAR